MGGCGDREYPHHIAKWLSGLVGLIFDNARTDSTQIEIFSLVIFRSPPIIKPSHSSNSTNDRDRNDSDCEGCKIPKDRPSKSARQTL